MQHAVCGGTCVLHASGNAPCQSSANVFALPAFRCVRKRLPLLGGALSPNHLRLTISYPLINLRLCPTLGAVFMAATALILAAACASTRCSSTLCGLTLPPLQQQHQQ